MRTTAEPPSAAIFPRIKNRAVLDAVSRIPEMSSDQRPLVEPIVGDLFVTYALDAGDSYVSVTPALCREHGIDMTSLHNTACMNCIGLLRDIRVSSAGGAYQLVVGQGLEACTILFPDLWSQIAAEIGGPVVVSFPHRDGVIYTRMDSREGMATLADFLSRCDFNDNHALSASMFLWRDERWEIYGVAPAA